MCAGFTNFELRNSSKADIFKTLRKRGRREYDDSAKSRRVRPLRRDRSSGLCGSDLAKSPTGLKNVCRVKSFVIHSNLKYKFIYPPRRIVEFSLPGLHNKAVYCYNIGVILKRSF